jgi:predicted amidohydrolase YtcJ
MQPDAPRAEAVAIRAGRIAAVGTTAEIRALAGPRTRVIELGGRPVIPGLVDAHCHLYGLGVSLESLSLRGLKSPEAVAQRVADAAAGRPEGEWITGRGWDQNLWTPPEFPARAALDAAAPRHPVALRRIDGHALWANAAALRAAGVGRDTPDPPGGKIFRDAQGEPTGVLIDAAMDLVEAKVPPDPPAVRERRILKAAHLAVSLGLTGVHEMGIDDGTVAVYRALAQAGRLPLRVVAYLSGEGQIEGLRARRPDADPDGAAMFVLRGVKLFSDGALGSRGAALLAPYSDDPGNVGLTVTPPPELARAARIAAETGFQLAVHAIGDRANREVLDAFAAAGAGPGRDLRFRVEHAQVVAPEDIARFAQLGVIASMQPTHATSDMPWAEARVGPSRIRGAYAWRSILATGAHMAFGSDFPVEEPSPLLGLVAAITRQDLEGRPAGGWLPEQRLTLEEALRAFTVEPAFAAFAEQHRGRIAPGLVADLTVFDRELVAERKILETEADWVIVGGRVVREAVAD